MYRVIFIENLTDPEEKVLAARAVANAISMQIPWYVNSTPGGKRCERKPIPKDANLLPYETLLTATPEGTLLQFAAPWPLGPDHDPKPAKLVQPQCHREILIRVDDVDNEQLQALMHNDDVRNIVTCGRYPTVFRDPGYPDFFVIWDAGEGPHNPYAFADDALADDGWFKLSAYPKYIWDYVSEIAKAQDLERSYAVFWMRGEDRA